MATLLAHIKVHAGREQAFEAMIRTLYEATHRLEPGCRRYEYWRGAEPGCYYCLLSFRDFTAFMEHQASDHHEAPEYPGFIERMRLEWLDPVAGASELPATAPQALPADASALMRAYAERMPPELADWWLPLR